VQAARVLASWTETGVTWSNQPGTSSVNVASGSSVASGWVQWDVTNQVTTMYSSANNGFLIRDGTESSGTSQTQTMHPRENTNDPELVITFG
jgi:hypothetical protein